MTLLKPEQTWFIEHNVLRDWNVQNNSLRDNAKGEAEVGGGGIR